MRFAKRIFVTILSIALVQGGACERRASKADSVPETAPKPRVCAVSPALSQMLLDMNLGDCLVGRHRFDAAAPQDLPVVGDQLEIDYEVLLALEPTDVLLQFGEQAIPPRLQQLAAEHGWNVQSFDIDSIDDIGRVIRRLPETISFADDATGRRQRAQAREATERLARDLQETLQPRQAVRDAGSLLLLWNVDPPSAFGPGSFIGGVVGHLGGRNAIRTGAYPELTLEDIIALDPQTILLLVHDDAETSVASRFGRMAELDLAAVRTGRLVIVQDPQVLIPSTSLTRVAAKIEAALAELGPVQAPTEGGP
ncbi:MAG: ABC transporter substrate-binding protein [Phycisphaerales bacterium JB039]